VSQSDIYSENLTLKQEGT